MNVYGFFIQVPALRGKLLEEFVRNNMPATKELIRRSRITRVSEKCRCCGITLVEICRRFEKIPTEDHTMLTFPEEKKSQIELLALADPGDHLKMKRDVCKIVYNNLCRQLRLQGYKFRRNSDY